MTADGLIDAVRTLNASDSFRPRLDPQQWRSFAATLHAVTLQPGDALLRQGEPERAVFFVGSGSLQQYAPQAVGGRRPVTLLRPGAVLGEPVLFTESPSVSPVQVEAVPRTTVFCLTRARFQELALRQPVVAMEVLRALGAVMARRMQAEAAPAPTPASPPAALRAA